MVNPPSKIPMVLIALAMLAVSAVPGRANVMDDHTCVFVEMVAALPDVLQDVRSGAAEEREFQTLFAASLRRLGDARRAAVLDDTQLGALRAYMKAVHADRVRRGYDPTDPGKAAMRGLSPETARQVAKIVRYYGCVMPRYLVRRTVDPSLAKGIQPEQILLLTGGVFVVAAVLLGYLGIDRREKRRICCAPVTIWLRGKAFDTNIANISRGGAMVEMPEDAPQASAIRLVFRDHQISGRVVWSNSNCCGVAFAEKLSHAEVNEIVANSVQRARGASRGATRKKAARPVKDPA